MTDDSAKVVRINGCPGGGKTTELFNRVQRHQRDGMEAGDMLYLTFTRTGRDEVADRLLGVFDGEEDEIDGRAKAFHGAACSECYHAGVIDDVGEQVIQPGSKVDDTDPYRDFCAARGLSYDDEEKSPLTDDTATPRIRETNCSRSPTGFDTHKTRSRTTTSLPNISNSQRTTHRLSNSSKNGIDTRTTPSSSRCSSTPTTLTRRLSGHSSQASTYSSSTSSRI